MAKTVNTTIKTTRYRSPKTGRMVSKRTKLTTKTRQTGGKTVEERMINSVTDPKQRAELIKQYQKNKAVTAGVASTEAAGTGITAAIGNKNTNVQTQVSSNSNLSQNIDGGIQPSTNQRDDDEVDEGFDHPGIN